MAHIAMNTDNHLARREFAGLGEIGELGVADHRAWIVGDPESREHEGTRVPPELLLGELGATTPGKVILFQPGPAPFLLDQSGAGFGAVLATPPMRSSIPFEPLQTPNVWRIGAGARAIGPIVSPVQSLLTPGGTTPPIVSTGVPPISPSAPNYPGLQIVTGPGASTQNTLLTSLGPAAGDPQLVSLVAGGQPATSATPMTSSWFTDPTQELISGIPNWGIMLAIAAAAMLMKGKR